MVALRWARGLAVFAVFAPGFGYAVFPFAAGVAALDFVGFGLDEAEFLGGEFGHGVFGGVLIYYDGGLGKPAMPDGEG